jgi:protein TonB
MKRCGSVLGLSMGLSLLLHLAIATPFFMVKKSPALRKQRQYTVATLVVTKKAPIKPQPVKRPQPLPKPAIEKPAPRKAALALPRPKRKPKLKPKPKPKTKTPEKLKPIPQPRPHARPRPTTKKLNQEKADLLPQANRREIDTGIPQKKSVKPVFGLTRESVQAKGDAPLSARIGNTLMKPQEEAFTPSEQVEDYHAIPAFELTSLPVYKIKVTPEYPESMKAEEVEGEVLLAVTIDARGKVVTLEVKRSDNALFTKAAQAALRRCEFTPGTQNGTPVATTIDIPIKFILDE